MTAAPLAPGLSPQQRLTAAMAERPQSDYVFDFWTALGWTILTFGIYSIYVFYQLVRRSRDHNRRRAELLAAMYELGWERASSAGRAEQMRPQFEQVAMNLEPLHRMTTDFRDPAIWTLLNVVGGGIVWLIGYILMDQDLVRHETCERAAAAGLAAIFAELGIAVPQPPAPVKRAHDYVGRVIALVFSLGFYAFWWTADVMREGNENFAADAWWEDGCWQALAAAPH